MRSAALCGFFSRESDVQINIDQTRTSYIVSTLETLTLPDLSPFH